MNDIVELKVPSKLEYISLVRLASSSIANAFNLNVDEIEDIKVCVNEACVNILNFSDAREIDIKFSLIKDRINISIKNVVENISEDAEYSKQGEMGLLIINSLMDEVEFKNNTITMVKYI